MKKAILIVVILCAWSGALAAASSSGQTPVLIDTDIGSDIDDALALAFAMRSPELKIVGVTTVSGDTEARARLAAKLLWKGGFKSVPVAAGEPGRPLPSEQTHWADKFSSREILHHKAVDFLDASLRRRPATTLICIGPLSNIAALLAKDAGVKSKIKRIVLMGGSINHGYGRDPLPVAEYNIAADPKSAQVVFSSGVPILMVPLDATAQLQLDRADRQRIFTELTPLTDSLTLLYHLWDRETPTMFDPMTVAMLIDPSLCQVQPMAITIDASGFTRSDPGAQANADVAVHADPSKFFDLYLKRVAP